MTEFVHGVETIEKTAGGVTVSGVKTAVIGLVGTAPVHLVAVANQRINIDELSVSDVDDATFWGPNIEGYTIPAALETLRKEGAKWVIVVNVFDPATHQASVAAAESNITAGKITLPHKGIISVEVKVSGGAGSALIEGTDYALDKAAGVITVLTGGALDGDAAANVAYVHGDPAAVDAAGVIGGVDGSGNRTGMQAWRNSFAKRGFMPKILLAPAYSTQASVVSALAALAPADKLRAIAAVDAPVGTTVAEAIAGRGPAGTINFNVSDDRLVLCAPHVEVYDTGAGDYVTAPLATCYAGVMAKTDAELGFWYSPSNKVAKSITGLEYPLTAQLNDSSCEATQLNAVGISTIFNAFGTGYRIWGNRTSIFPSDTSVKSFVTQRRIADQIHESLELAMMPHIDKPISSTIIADVLQGANDYMRTLTTRGAVLPGSRVEFQAAKNPVSELQKGKATWTLIFVGPPPLEAAVFESVTDVSLLSALLAEAS